MFDTKYTLQKYSGSNSRFRCPACEKFKEFTRYIDTETGEYLSEFVGKCNRIDKCGYHYTPKQYFIDNTIINNGNQQRIATPGNKYQQQNKQHIQQQIISYIPYDIMEKSLGDYENNRFVQGLLKLYGEEITTQLIQKFLIGTARLPMGGTIFWQIDNKNKVRTGKIMLYDSNTLKRNKNNKSNNVDWVHSRMTKQHPATRFNLKQCLFGLHQLNNTEPTETIAIVESEKTAIIASIYMPQYIWMATGGANLLNAEMLMPLKGRNIMLFPDVNQYEYWSNKVQQWVTIANNKSNNINNGIANIVVSDYLEVHATPEMRNNGSDLADSLIKRDETGLAVMDAGWPVMWH